MYFARIFIKHKKSGFVRKAAILLFFAQLFCNWQLLCAINPIFLCLMNMREKYMGPSYLSGMALLAKLFTQQFCAHMFGWGHFAESPFFFCHKPLIFSSLSPFLCFSPIPFSSSNKFDLPILLSPILAAWLDPQKWGNAAKKLKIGHFFGQRKRGDYVLERKEGKKMGNAKNAPSKNKFILFFRVAQLVAYPTVCLFLRFLNLGKRT